MICYYYLTYSKVPYIYFITLDFQDLIQLSYLGSSHLRIYINVCI